jgi:hypothetical protein
MWLSVVVGVAALLLPALTDHPTGLVRIMQPADSGDANRTARL